MRIAADGSLYAPEQDVAGGSSRSTSPNHLYVTESSPRSDSPSIPTSPQLGYLQADQGYPQHTNTSHGQSGQRGSTNPYSQQILPPPHLQHYTPQTPVQPTPAYPGPLRHTPLGPRAPIPHSRTPSPDVTTHHDTRGLRAVSPTQLPGTNVENLRNSFERVNVSALRSTGRDSPQSTRWQLETTSQPPTRSHSLEEDGEEEYKTPIRPSAKALGKRKVVEKPVDRTHITWR